MNPRRRFAATISLVLMGTGFLFAAVPLVRPESEERTIRIEASRFAFSPGVVHVNEGDRVTIELVAQDVVHGLYIDGYDRSITADPGRTARLSFVADRSGSFRFRCSVACGSLHPFMVGQLKVGRNWLLWKSFGLVLVGALVGLVWRWE